jgi:hypothetical protein
MNIIAEQPEARAPLELHWHALGLMLGFVLIGTALLL